MNGATPSAGAPYKQGWSKFTRSDRRGRDNLPLGFITGVNASLPGGLKVTALAYNENTDWRFPVFFHNITVLVFQVT